jgi:hypothetical protein
MLLGVLQMTLGVGYDGEGSLPVPTAAPAPRPGF